MLDDVNALIDEAGAPSHGNEPSLPAPTVGTTVQRLTRPLAPDAGAWTSTEHDDVASESPVALVFNGISHVVMMATPRDLDAFALGFALSEGLISRRDECHGIEVTTSTRGIEVQLQVSSKVAAFLKERRRLLAGRTGCGLCGIDSLQQLDLHPPPIRPQAWIAGLGPDVVLRACSQLGAHQPLNALTGACHAAAWATPDGELTTVMEDVGRHNALDKLLGRRVLDGSSDEPGFVIMSSRASYELVRKCARLNVPALATISAPTSLAIDIARLAGVRLYGFCRGDSVVRYDAGHD